MSDSDMKMSKHTCALSVVSGIIALLFLVTVNQAEDYQTNSASSKSSIADATGGILLQLQYESGRIKNKDPVPPLRIYDDGLVLIHYPRYTTRAGDYRLQLKDAGLAEIRGWMKECDLREGLLDSIRSQRHIAVQARKAAGVRPVTFQIIPDRSTTVIKYRLGVAGGAEALGLEEVSCYDLQNQAEQFPEISALVKLAKLERKLLALAKHKDLKRIEK